MENSYHNLSSKDFQNCDDLSLGWVGWMAAGDVVCSWGRGEDGQLGHGDAEERHLPTIVSALEDSEISSITCGADHTTALSAATQTVYSWGWSVHHHNLLLVQLVRDD